MKQFEQVIEAMRENGGYATLGYLYHNVDVTSWKTKTPFASMRRIVQDDRFFFKIKPGLWALKELKQNVLKKFKIETSKTKSAEFNHTYYQGLLVEIGNLRGYSTYIPPQDKNKLYLEQKLGSIAEITSIFEFSYPEIIRRARTIDVIWFNDRKMPLSFFEVEHSTDIYNSLIKFSDLRDFHSSFCIVADDTRKREFGIKISANAFKEVKNRISFMSYEELSVVHTNTYKLSTVRKNFDFLRN